MAMARLAQTMKKELWKRSEMPSGVMYGSFKIFSWRRPYVMRLRLRHMASVRKDAGNGALESSMEKL